MPPYNTLDYNSFLGIPYFWWLWQFWGLLARYIIGCHSWSSFDDFVIKILGLWVLGGNNTKRKCYCHDITSRVHTINMTSSWPWSLALSGTCQISPLYSYSPPPCFPYCIFHTVKKVTIHSPHSMSGTLWFTSLRENHLHKLLGILQKRCLFSLIYQNK